MCDTIVALSNSTLDGSVIFGKNSDREPNEAQQIILIPASKHRLGESIQCTYLTIPQVENTYAVLLSKPFWMWGAEMGANEFGVTIGNEAVFTRTPYGKEPGLIGMDMLRLALERSHDADQALRTIIDLLEKYGQGGNCGFTHRLYYHNSFLICDPEKAWVLETSGKDWAAERVKSVRSISNAITIDNHWDMASETLVSNAVKNGWCKNPEDFSFARCYSDTLYTTFSDARKRHSCTTQMLLQGKGKITPELMMDALRVHSDNSLGFSPAHGITGADVCCHAGWGPIRGSQTVGSMVSHLKKDGLQTHWLTGTAAPCTSLFKPIWIDTGIPEHGNVPTGTYDDASLYWRHEVLHREILRDYQTRMPIVSNLLKGAQQMIIEKATTDTNNSKSNCASISWSSFKVANDVEQECLSLVRKTRPSHHPDWLYASAWKKFNKEAGIILE